MSNESYSKATNINSLVLYMMQFVFIEIRSASSLKAAKKFADIFHNVPVLLLKSRSIDDEQLILNGIIERAKNHNMDEYIKKLIELSQKEIAEKTS